MIVDARFDDHADEHAVMSTWLTTQMVLAQCHERNRPFWHLDSAWIHPADPAQRYYRLTRNGNAPTLQSGRSLRTSACDGGRP